MKVLIVEDEPSVGRVVRAILQQEGYEADHVMSAGDARAAVAHGRYDAILLDLGLGASSGIDLLQDLRGEGIATPVLVLTGEGREAVIVRALDAGADEYMVKPVRPPELAARLRALFRRCAAEAPAAEVAVGSLVVDRLSRTASVRGRALNLSPREFVLLDQLVRHADSVMTRPMLLERVWQMDFDPGSNVVDVHVARLRRKLEAADAPVQITTHRGAGFSLTRRDEMPMSGARCPLSGSGTRHLVPGPV